MRTTAPEQDVARWIVKYTTDLCLAELLCDRHDADALAATVTNAQLVDRRYTFGELRDLSGRCAIVLAEIGIAEGDRVAVLLPKRIEQLVSLLAIIRLGAVHVPLFTAFAAPTVTHRLQDCGAKLVITDAANRNKVTAGVPSLTVEGLGELNFWDAVRSASGAVTPAVYAAGQPFALLYTSGTTGDPAGVEVPARALAAFHAATHFALDLRPDDIYWNAADPAWAYGFYYALLGPLLLGRPTLLLNATFDPELAWSLLSHHAVTNLAAPPTFYRALRNHAPERSLPLRIASSAGEPLTPDLVDWSQRVFGTPIHDAYGQTETGVVIANHHDSDLARELVPGAMGIAMPGFSPRVLGNDAELEALPGEPGRLILDVQASPLFWFQGYYRQPVRSRERFLDGGRLYTTGDAAYHDSHGLFTFCGRTDDLILTAGYRIGPFEIENALCQHPDVLEAAAVGQPDPLRGQAIHAYVVLRRDRPPSDELGASLQQLVRDQLARHAYPRHIHFVQQLPKTPSGKIQRHLLRSP